ncbi:MAG: copper chaperone PCu(A)C [Deltaproteobacteria bacterium]|nr:copper chaperone PCu(A)C [Deltaproteobacteria bacterium]
MRTLHALALFTTLSLANIGSAPRVNAAEPSAATASVKISDPELRVTPNGVGAFYVTIENTSDIDDTLKGATCTSAKHVAMHETVVVKDVARMVEAKSFPVPKKSKLVLLPGGKHVMLMELKTEPGKEITVTLAFEKAGQIPVTVRGMAMGKAAGH